MLTPVTEAWEFILYHPSAQQPDIFLWEGITSGVFRYKHWPTVFFTKLIHPQLGVYNTLTLINS